MQNLDRRLKSMKIDNEEEKGALRDGDIYGSQVNNKFPRDTCIDRPRPPSRCIALLICRYSFLPSR